MPSVGPAPPQGFPAAVQYLDTPTASRLLSPHHKATYCTPCPPHLLPNPPPKLAIRKISDSKHPANGQSGLFSAGNKKLERGTWIRDYVGVVHPDEETDPKSDYDLSLSRTVVPVVGGAEGETKVEVVGIDATKAGNEARFVNDYRGTGAPRANAVFELRSWDIPGSNPPRQGIRMAVWAGPHGVEKGAELLVSYGGSFWAERRKEWQAEAEATAASAAAASMTATSVVEQKAAGARTGTQKEEKGRKGVKDDKSKKGKKP